MEQHKDRLIETLSRGRDFAQRLQNVLLGQTNVDGTISVKDLVTQILDSFSAGLSLLNSSDSAQIYRVRELLLASPVDRNISEACAGKKPATGHVKQRRGCYKRRRTIDSSVKISSTIEDGYAWRKYGQKEILNSKFPRCYFRCTHRHIHGCKAVKQVQKLENESNMFHITYFGQHTCPKPINTLSHHKVADIDFEDINNHNHFSNSPSTIRNYIPIDPFVKQEVDSKAQSTDVSDIISTGNDDQSPPSLMLDEVFRADHHLGSCDHEDVASFMRFDQQLEDSCASTSSHHDYLNMEFLNTELLSDILLDGRVFPRLS